MLSVTSFHPLRFCGSDFLARFRFFASVRFRSFASDFSDFGVCAGPGGIRELIRSRSSVLK